MREEYREDESTGDTREPPDVAGPYWLIRNGGDAAGSPDGGGGLLTFDLSGRGKFLPVFGDREGALGFLQGMDENLPRPHAEVAYMGRARLASTLRGSLADVDRVAFDPPPAHDPSAVDLTSMGRVSFIDLLLGRGRAWSDRADRGGTLQRRRGASLGS